MISISGKGVHSGLMSRVTVHQEPGPVNFIRQGVRIPVRLESVSGTDRATSLSAGGETVSMVEHLLAALYLKGWWQDLSIEVSNWELPVLDGSAAEWLPLLDALSTPPPPPAALELSAPVVVQEGKGSASVQPGPAGLDVTILFDHPGIGMQRWRGGPDDYHELADARTFGFLSDLEDLHRSGLALGAGLDNCLVFGPETTVNPQRFELEPVKHKALDALGDLYLLGRPVAGLVRTACGSHRLHAKLVAEIRQQAGLETAF